MSDKFYGDHVFIRDLDIIYVLQLKILYKNTAKRIIFRIMLYKDHYLIDNLANFIHLANKTLKKYIILQNHV